MKRKFDQVYATKDPLEEIEAHKKRIKSHTASLQRSNECSAESFLPIQLELLRLISLYNAIGQYTETVQRAQSIVSMGRKIVRELGERKCKDIETIALANLRLAHSMRLVGEAHTCSDVRKANSWFKECLSQLKAGLADKRLASHAAGHFVAVQRAFRALCGSYSDAFSWHHDGDDLVTPFVNLKMAEFCGQAALKIAQSNKIQHISIVSPTKCMLKCTRREEAVQKKVVRLEDEEQEEQFSLKQKQEMEANALHELGYIFTMQKQFDQAYHYYERAKKLHSSLHMAVEEARDGFGMGNILLLQGKYEEALGFFFQFSRAAEPANATEYLVEAFSTIGQTFLEQKKFRSAREYFLKAKQHALKLKENSLKREKTADDLERVEAMQKLYHEADKVLKRYTKGPIDALQYMEALSHLKQMQDYKQLENHTLLLLKQCDSLHSVHRFRALSFLSYSYTKQEKYAKAISIYQEQLMSKLGSNTRNQVIVKRAKAHCKYLIQGKHLPHQELDKVVKEIIEAYQLALRSAQLRKYVLQFEQYMDLVDFFQDIPIAAFTIARKGAKRPVLPVTIRTQLRTMQQELVSGIEDLYAIEFFPVKPIVFPTIQVLSPSVELGCDLTLQEVVHDEIKKL